MIKITEKCNKGNSQILLEATYLSTQYHKNMIIHKIYFTYIPYFTKNNIE